jgi:hypothetical protein
MDIFNLIDGMNPFIGERDWDGLEIEFANVAKLLGGAELTDKIAQIDISEYQKRMCDGLSSVVPKAKTHKAKAVYFEYDLDNNWDSHFFVCENYKPIKNEYKPGDDDWACDWIEDFALGRFKPFGDLYLPEFGETEVSRGVNLFLIARTVAAFGRCSDKYASETLALCMGFHDQDPIVRVNES